VRKEPLILVHLDQLLAVLQKKVPRLVLKVDQRELVVKILQLLTSHFITPKHTTAVRTETS